MPSPSGDRYGEGVARILVVDDDDTVRGVVTDYLRAAGMQVAGCAVHPPWPGKSAST